MSSIPLQTSYVHGRHIEAAPGAPTFDSINPATGEVLATVQGATPADIEHAVASASEGQQAWASLTAVECGRCLRRAVEILRERNDALARLETLDTGKAYAETSRVEQRDRKSVV